MEARAESRVYAEDTETDRRQDREKERSDCTEKILFVSGMRSGDLVFWVKSTVSLVQVQIQSLHSSSVFVSTSCGTSTWSETTSDASSNTCRTTGNHGGSVVQSCSQVAIKRYSKKKTTRGRRTLHHHYCHSNVHTKHQYSFHCPLQDALVNKHARPGTNTAVCGQ